MFLATLVLMTGVLFALFFFNPWASPIPYLVGTGGVFGEIADKTLIKALDAMVALAGGLSAATIVNVLSDSPSGMARE